MFKYHIAMVALTFMVSASLLYMLLKRQKAINIKKHNDKGERFASQSKPIFGGVIFISSFLLTFIVLAATQLASAFTFQSYAILLVTIVSFAMGFIDDIKSTNPRFKFLTQLLCSIILIYSGIYIHISSNEIINYLLTIFWVVGLMNSINMLDNMDAITASVSLVILSSFVLFSNSAHSVFIFLCIGTIGSLLAFLIWNWSPAKLYMGDNGSQFLGIILAIAGILGIWNNSSLSNTHYQDFTILSSAIAAFIIPITDTTTVTINRLLQRKSPFVGGRDHTTHNLFYWGLPVKYIAITYITISIATNYLAYYILHRNNNSNFSSIITINIISLVIFGILYSLTKFKRRIPNK